jgi:hypothetical protein
MVPPEHATARSTPITSRGDGRKRKRTGRVGIIIGACASALGPRAARRSITFFENFPCLRTSLCKIAKLISQNDRESG